MTRRGRLAAIGVLASLLVVGCGDDGAAARISWCAGHQAAVARAALAMGLMQPGQRYEDWKYGEGEYRRACDEAYRQPQDQVPGAS